MSFFQVSLCGLWEGKAPGKVGLSSFCLDNGGLSVMMDGLIKMLRWCVGSWATGIDIWKLPLWQLCTSRNKAINSISWNPLWFTQVRYIACRLEVSVSHTALKYVKFQPDLWQKCIRLLILLGFKDLQRDRSLKPTSNSHLQMLSLTIFLPPQARVAMSTVICLGWTSSSQRNTNLNTGTIANDAKICK